MMFKYSIIIPVYNAEKYIEETVNSIIESTYRDIEVICIDDGSKDNSLRILQDLALKDDRIKVLHQENAGVCTARNNAIHASAGKYIFPMDADNILMPNYIAKAVKILDENIRSFTEVSDYKNAFDAADYSSKLFNMFSGEIQEMELYCENSIIEEILDRFGSAAKVRRTDNEEHFKVLVKAVVSEGLASWVMQYGNKIEIKSPLILRNMVKDKAEEIAALYKNDIFKV